MNDALLSNSLQIASGGVGPLVTLWSRTRGNLDVRGVGALNSMPLYLVTRDPQVRSVRDLSDKDRIALPAAKISVQALALQMAAEQVFGPGQQNRFDALTVSMAHPDAMQALLSGQSEVNAHFGSPPYQYQELARPGMHLVLNNYDVMGGAVTFNVVWTTARFRNDNPETLRRLYCRPGRGGGDDQPRQARSRRGLPAHHPGQGFARRTLSACSTIRKPYSRRRRKT